MPETTKQTVHPNSPNDDLNLSNAASTVARALADEFGVECSWEQLETADGIHHFLGVKSKDGTPISVQMNVTP